VSPALKLNIPRTLATLPGKMPALFLPNEKARSGSSISSRRTSETWKRRR
jgi:hypothetical protein